ncbi:SAM-dependent methyltransferase [Streptomonospora alba]|uniref:SAM-dependent methyltransferase n=1 Tax=Streptomonospora alba TaxID=183763 RepID=UPI00069AE965|nr:SAM-dependent methyltransferase [Streptomonospora alba]
MTSDDEGVPPSPAFTTDKATPARVYDALLGGKDNYAADRAAAARIKAREPNAELVVHANRAFLRRAVTYLVANAGIRQIIDLGSGLPEQDNVHQVAQTIAPETRVVYVDNDPIVATHGHARLADNPNTAVITADLRDTTTVMDAPETRHLIDPTQPWALLAVAVFHFIPEDPAEIVAAYRAHMPPGSHLALSHLSQDATTPEVAEEITRTYAEQATAPMVLRSREEITRIFARMALVPPGLALIMNWRPPVAPVAPDRVWLFGGVGRLPAPPDTRSATSGKHAP